MDPFMVRQQEEAEAASRLRSFASLSETVPPQWPFIEERNASRWEPSEPIPPVNSKPGRGSVWFSGFWNVALTATGLWCGVKLGVDLSLVPLQTLAAGIAGGFALGWGGTGLWLRRSYDLSSTKAFGVPLLPTVTTLAVMAAAMKLAEQFTVIAPPELVEAVEDMPADVLILTGGVLLSYALAVGRMWNTLRG